MDKQNIPNIGDKLITDIIYHILIEGIEKKATDILIEPCDDKLQTRFRINGLLYHFKDFAFNFHPKIVIRMKVLSNLDISEHRLPQDGRFRVKLPGKEVDFRVSIIPSRLGEKIALRILDKEKLTLDINKLGLEDSPLTSLKKNLIKPYGVILICGPTGCGKTTTVYASLKYIDSIEKNIITVEDPIEYQLYGINQVSVNEEIGFTFPVVLRSILRQDPDIILIGEIRDTETAEIAIKSALTGHLVLSTLHTTTATGAIIRLINMGIEPFLISSAALLVAAQRLVKLLCPKCKEEQVLSDQFLTRLKKEEKSPLLPPFIKGGLGGILTDKEFKYYKARGCPQCNQTGYIGRTIIMEAMEITAGIKNLIHRNVSEQEIRKMAVSCGMQTLKENLWTLLRDGAISVEEALSIIS